MGWKAHLIKFTRIVDQTINPARLHKSFVVGHKSHLTSAFVTECKHMSATHSSWFSGEVPFQELNLNFMSLCFYQYKVSVPKTNKKAVS